MQWTPVVGDLVWPPERVRSVPGADDIWSEPGRVVSLDDGWAMVDRGSWGQFGMPASELVPCTG